MNQQAWTPQVYNQVFIFQGQRMDTDSGSKSKSHWLVSASFFPKDFIQIKLQVVATERNNYILDEMHWMYF